ncbi:MAG: hypothetical protein ABIS51_07695 [Sphingomonas sp.]
MHTLLAIPFLWAIGVLPFAAEADANKPTAAVNEETVITAVSADPIAPSGILATAVEFSGDTKGLATNYYIPFMSVGQAKPKVGQTCKVSWQWHASFLWITATGSAQGVRLVTHFSCEGGPEGSF